MSWKSKVYIGIIAFSLAVIVAILSARRIQSVWFTPASAEDSESSAESYYPFTQQSSAEEKVVNRMLIAPTEEEAYVPEKQMQKPYFGGQINLPALAKEQESYTNSARAAGDINHPSVKDGGDAVLEFNKEGSADILLDKFVEDMKKALGEDALKEPLSPEELTDKILKNPQMRKILLQYSKNPEMMKIVDAAIDKAAEGR